MVHDHIHKHQPLVPILHQMNPVHILPSYLLMICFKIISYLLPRLPSVIFPSGFLTKTCYAFLILPCVLHSLYRLDFINLTAWWMQIMKVLMQFSPHSFQFLHNKSKYFLIPCSQTPLTYVLPLMWETKLYTYRKL
jgi:hypothetical protein